MFGEAVGMPVDSDATPAAINLLKLLRSMPGRGQILAAQHMGAQYTYYQSEIMTITNGFTEQDSGGSKSVPATNKLPAIINYDIDFQDCYQPTWVGMNSQSPSSPRTPHPYWAYQGTASGNYGDPVTNPAPPGIDGAVTQWGAGTIIGLTFHFDCPLTGGQFNDLSDPSYAAYKGGATTVVGATNSGASEAVLMLAMLVASGRLLVTVVVA